MNGLAPFDLPKAKVLFGDLRFFHFTGKSEKEESTMEKSCLETTPIPKLMRKYALPCVISLLVAALYNIVDQIFIANASYLGSYGNAANTVVFPLTVVASVTPCSKKCAIIFLKTSLFHLVFAAKTVVYE